MKKSLKVLLMLIIILIVIVLIFMVSNTVNVKNQEEKTKQQKVIENVIEEEEVAVPEYDLWDEKVFGLEEQEKDNFIEWTKYQNINLYTAIAFKNYLKNHGYDEEINFTDTFLFTSKYYDNYVTVGDSTFYSIFNSNYDQYNYIEDKIEYVPYKDIIEIKGAVLDDCSNTYGDTLDERVKNQALSWEKEHKKMREGETFSDLPLEKDLYFELTGLTIMNGNNLSKDDYYNNARAKRIKITVNDDKENIITLEDTYDVQLIDFDYMQKGISKPIDVKIEVLDYYEGKESNDVYIADIQMGIMFNGTHGR